MAATLVSDFVDISTALKEEQALSPGQYEIRFYISEPVSSRDIADARAYLKSEGVDVRNIYQQKSNGLYFLGVQYVKHPVSDSIAFLPLAVIPLIGFALTAVLVGVGIFKLDSIANNIGKILLITLGGTIALAALLRKPIEKVSEAATRKYL
jgi:hypothetical protein